MKRLVYFFIVAFFLMAKSVSAQNLEIESNVYQLSFGPETPQMEIKPNATGSFALPLGYRAMVEMGGGVQMFNWGCLGITTTHGYQFNQNIYLGGLVGFLYVFDLSFMPVIAADFRVYMGKNSIHKPYIGLTLGFPQAEVSFGMRFTLNKRNAINVALHCGLNAQLKFGFEF